VKKIFPCFKMHPVNNGGRPPPPAAPWILHCLCLGTMTYSLNYHQWVNDCHLYYLSFTAMKCSPRNDAPATRLNSNRYIMLTKPRCNDSSHNCKCKVTPRHIKAATNGQNLEIVCKQIPTKKAVVVRRYLRQGKAIRQVASPSSLCQRFPYAPFNAMVTKISKWSRIQDSCRITSKI